MYTDQVEPAGRLLTTRNACRHVDASRATLYRAARRGDLHPVRLSRHFTRWPLADLDAWIKRAATPEDKNVGDPTHEGSAP